MVSSVNEPGEPNRPLLTIDTSSAQAGVALYDGALLSFRSWSADRTHTTTLLSEIHHLLEAASLEVRDLAAIGIAVGPGAFTGLRVGFGVAKGFHLATGAPLIGISTLEATAFPVAVANCSILATIGAGRGRLVWAHYRANVGQLVETSPPRNGVASELAAEITGRDPVIVAGELDQEQASIIAATGASVPPPPLRVRHPAAFAAIAWRRLRAGTFDDATLLEPVYLSH